MVAQIQVVNAAVESVFIFKEEPTEFPDGLDVEYERKTESNTTLKFVTHASGRMELPSVGEEKMTGEARLAHAWCGEGEKTREFKLNV